VSWVVTVNDLQNTPIPADALELIGQDNRDYIMDAEAAYTLAKRRGITTATLSGGRTPSPYPGGTDTIVISIVGFMGPQEFKPTMVATITSRAEQTQQEENSGRQ
jgi:hypothetical protein